MPDHDPSWRSDPRRHARDRPHRGDAGGEGCEDVEDPDPQTWCSFRVEGGSTTFRMNYSDTEGWTVFGVFQTAD
jgi:hypothetical protein